jgi:PAS domain S-box-containing protein
MQKIVWVGTTGFSVRDTRPPFDYTHLMSVYQDIFAAIPDGVIIQDTETGRVLDANPAAGSMHGYAREDFIGLTPTDFVHPDDDHLFAQFVQKTQSGETPNALALHQHHDGFSFFVELHGTAFVYQGRSCLLTAVKEVDQRVRVEQQLQQQVEARKREQAALLEISQTLTSALELKPGLILDQLRLIVDYRHAALFVLEASDLVALAVRGPQPLPPAMPIRIQLPEPESLALLFNGHQPQRIADVWTDDPAAQFLRAFLNQQGAALLAGVRSWMWVPLAINSRLIGGMGIAHAEVDRFTTHQANLALMMANQAAIALVNAQLYEQAQTLATLEERQRLAKNLHDAVNQSLFSAGLIAEVLPRLWERSPEEGLQSLEDLRRLTRSAMAEMRGLLAELRPLVLTDSDLGDLLRQLGDALMGRTNIPVIVRVQGERTLPVDVQVALYRLCQEALNNIAKHAAASEVAINLHVGHRRG